jgi:hypothetical protein
MLPCLKRAGFVWEWTQAANAWSERPSAKRHGRTRGRGQPKPVQLSTEAAAQLAGETRGLTAAQPLEFVEREA